MNRAKSISLRNFFISFHLHFFAFWNFSFVNIINYFFLLFLRWKRGKKFGSGHVLLLVIYLPGANTSHSAFIYCLKFCFISWLQFPVIDKDKRNNNNCLDRMKNICKLYYKTQVFRSPLFDNSIYFIRSDRQSSRLYKMQKRQQRQQQQAEKFTEHTKNVEIKRKKNS